MHTSSHSFQIVAGVARRAACSLLTFSSGSHCGKFPEVAHLYNYTKTRLVHSCHSGMARKTNKIFAKLILIDDLRGDALMCHNQHRWMSVCVSQKCMKIMFFCFCFFVLKKRHSAVDGEGYRGHSHGGRETQTAGPLNLSTKSAQFNRGEKRRDVPLFLSLKIK